MSTTAWVTAGRAAPTIGRIQASCCPYCLVRVEAHDVRAPGQSASIVSRRFERRLTAEIRGVRMPCLAGTKRARLANYDRLFGWPPLNPSVPSEDIS